MKSSIIFPSLLIATFALAGPPAERQLGQDKAHHVAGHCYTDLGFAVWSHNYAVVESKDGIASGMVTCYLIEYATEDTPEFILNYAIEVECLEIDSDTKTAWIGGYVVQTDQPDFLPLGLYMVVYAHGGGPGGRNDTHGDNVPSWLGLEDTCDERVMPLFEDPVHRGNIVVK